MPEPDFNAIDRVALAAAAAAGLVSPAAISRAEHTLESLGLMVEIIDARVKTLECLLGLDDG